MLSACTSGAVKVGSTKSEPKMEIPSAVHKYFIVPSGSKEALASKLTSVFSLALKSAPAFATGGMFLCFTLTTTVSGSESAPPSFTTSTKCSNESFSKNGVTKSGVPVAALFKRTPSTEDHENVKTVLGELSGSTEPEPSSVTFSPSFFSTSAPAFATGFRL